MDRSSDVIKEDIVVLNKSIGKVAEEVRVLVMKKQRMIGVREYLQKELERVEEYEYSEEVIKIAREEELIEQHNA